jgi:hypothetical protein
MMRDDTAAHQIRIINDQQRTVNGLMVTCTCRLHADRPRQAHGGPHPNLPPLAPVTTADEALAVWRGHMLGLAMAGLANIDAELAAPLI